MRLFLAWLFLIHSHIILRIDTQNRQALANQAWKVYRSRGDSIGHCFLRRLPDSHHEILYGRAIYTPACLCLFGSPVYLFVQCLDGGKWWNPTPLYGLIFQHATLWDEVSRLSTKRPISVSPHYAMLAWRVERHDGLCSSMATRSSNSINIRVSRQKHLHIGISSKTT